jgi:PE family
MTTVVAQPEAIEATAGGLRTINASMRAANAAAAAPTIGVAPAAADLVSMLTAVQFSSHGQRYQDVSAQAAIVQDMLATMLGVSAGSYAATETANTTAVG